MADRLPGEMISGEGIVWGCAHGGFVTTACMEEWSERGRIGGAGFGVGMRVGRRRR